MEILWQILTAMLSLSELVDIKLFIYVYVCIGDRHTHTYIHIYVTLCVEFSCSYVQISV